MRRPTLRTFRRCCQAGFLLLFLVLFRLTEYAGSDQIPWAVNLLFRWDPLVAASVILADKTLIMLLLPALFVVVLTILLGRVFCGWICPLGTLIDAGDRLLSPSDWNTRRLRRIKFLLLLLTLLSALFGLQLVGFVDPFSILVRGLTLAADPLLSLGSTALFDILYLQAPAPLGSLGEQVRELTAPLFAYQRNSFLLAGTSGLLLVLIFLLGLLAKRFWCRSFCPLGALLSLLSRFSILRRVPPRSCRDCQGCAQFCRMDAFDRTDGRLHHGECILCMDCIDDCRNQPARFSLTRPPRQVPFDQGRRSLVLGGVIGLALPLSTLSGSRARQTEAAVLRPPGAVDHPHFLQRCVRCGECMKVCITGGLQPCFTESGLEGMFSPRLVPRIGYCEFNCTLCSQVCPTGAIEPLSLERKHGFTIGIAWLDKNRCLPYVDGTPCIVCEEHCPTHDKAIKFRRATVRNSRGEPISLRQPYVIAELCIGCGICENKCPVGPRAAILVEPPGETAAQDGY